MTRVCVLDYGMGNLRSVSKAIERVGAAAVNPNDHEVARSCDGLVLPGVGAFARGMERIGELELDRLIGKWVDGGRPLLGICLGFQLLFESSTELGGAAGLGLIEGEVGGLDAEGLKVPHIGWEPVRWESASELIHEIDDETPFYFVHSFAPHLRRNVDLLGTAVHGTRFACAIARAPIFGVQFHAEKSSAAGLRLLGNFADLCAGPAGTGRVAEDAGGVVR